MTSPPRSARQTAPPRHRNSEGFIPKFKIDQCFTYKRYKHHKSQCLSKFVGFTEKKSTDDELEEEIYEPTKEMVREAKAKKASQRVSKGITGVVRPYFCIYR